MQSWYRRPILKYSLKHSDYVVVLTQNDKKTYQEKGHRQKNIMTIYNPMPKIKENFFTKEKWLISVGHLIHRKGIDYLAKVAHLVLSQATDWKWLVVGDGEEQPFLKQFIQENHLEEQLILVGRTFDVYSLLAKAQIYVMTSRQEGLPMCLLEAKALRLPSVSFDIPTGPNEMIEEGINGYLISPFDCEEMALKLLSLIQDPSLRQEFSNHAQSNLDQFKLERIIENWNKVLNTLLGEGDERSFP